MHVHVQMQGKRLGCGVQASAGMGAEASGGPQYVVCSAPMRIAAALAAVLAAEQVQCGGHPGGPTPVRAGHAAS
jgi:hypothetical protein